MQALRGGPGGGIGPLLRTEKLTVRFGGLAALNGVDFAVHARRNPGDHRAERRGEKHILQLPDRRAQTDRRAHLFDGEDITGLPPNRISQKGIARSYQITNILPNATRARERAHRRAVAPARLEPRRASSAPSPIINEKADTRARFGRAAEEKRASSPPTCRMASSASSRSAIALATEPSLLCLDEPTAGMSTAETRDTVALVRRSRRT